MSRKGLRIARANRISCGTLPLLAFGATTAGFPSEGISAGDVNTFKSSSRYAIASGDFDNDGNWDAAFGNGNNASTEGEVLVLYGDPGWTYT